MKKETKENTQVIVQNFEEYLLETQEGKEATMLNANLIKRELSYFTSEENKDSKGLFHKVGNNDESYKMILRNIKFNVSSCLEEFRTDIENYFINDLVKELSLKNLWKKRGKSFTSKTLVNLDYTQFILAQVKQGRLQEDKQYKVDTNRTRYVAIDETGGRHYPSSINWNSIDLIKEETKEEEETETE